jgi:integrase
VVLVRTGVSGNGKATPAKAAPRCTRADATKAAGISGARPYDLRHSYISLLIAQGATVVEVAQQAGHSPTMALSTYAHLFDEHDRDERRSAEDLIRAARATQGVREVSGLCPSQNGY